MLPAQESVFWEIIDIFNKQGLLPHVMLVGSWAEYIYERHYLEGFTANLRTRDVDFLYRNIRRPAGRIDISQALKDKGFVYTESRTSGVGKFAREELEIEILVRVLGKGDSLHSRIPSLGLTGVGLREINMLNDYPLVLECNGYTLIVPEPEAYILQKLFINPKRGSDKRDKDMQSIRSMLEHVDKDRTHDILARLNNRQIQTIKTVCEQNVVYF
jgi:hypothetical protein